VEFLPSGGGGLGGNAGLPTVGLPVRSTPAAGCSAEYFDSLAAVIVVVVPWWWFVGTEFNT